MKPQEYPFVVCGNCGFEQDMRANPVLDAGWSIYDNRSHCPTCAGKTIPELREIARVAREKKLNRTQLERADAIRARFKAMYPELVRLKEELLVVLDEAQVLPADGGKSDQTIGEVQFRQLRGIEMCTSRLLLALLFDTRTP